VIWQGAAEANTGVPGEISGAGPSRERVLRASAFGHVQALAAIGDRIDQGMAFAQLREDSGVIHDLRAPFSGVLRGLIHPSVLVMPAMKIGDLDARAQPEACYTVSDKALAIGGGVLEAILSQRRTLSGRLPNEERDDPL
jgi:xanthine dehydrogenase accessory factor